MNRMDKLFPKMQENGEKILVSYFPLGDSYVADTVEWAKRFFDHGTTVLEIGLPYENPFLDGATVAATMERALKRTDLNTVLGEIGEVRKALPDAVLQVMTYFENIMKYGVPEFARICSELDVDAVLAPNANPEQMAELDAALAPYHIHNLRFIPYHFGEETVADLQKNAGGYVYLQAVDGKTGSSSEITPQIRENIERLHAAGVNVPLIPGFGISTPDHVRTYLGMGSDGVIIGSAIINHIIDGTFSEYLDGIRAALDE